jgi:uncharacterized lipoprotein YbaY
VVTGVTLLPSEASTAFAQKDDKPTKAKVSGTIGFRGEAQFEPDTVARVMLVDVSLADAPARKVGEKVIKELKKFPISFEVEYDPTASRRGTPTRSRSGSRRSSASTTSMTRRSPRLAGAVPPRT